MFKKSIGALSLFFVLTPAVFAGNSESELLNKKNVIDFYNKALNDKDFSSARPYLGIAMYSITRWQKMAWKASSSLSLF